MKFIARIFRETLIKDTPNVFLRKKSIVPKDGSPKPTLTKEPKSKQLGLKDSKS